MSLILRIDDFTSTRESEFYRHNLQNFKKFDQVFKDLDLNYILGCIPKFTTKEHIEWFKDQDNITLAIHGINHDERFPNEFREYESLRYRIQSFEQVKKRWKNWGYNKEIDSYIPPHNILDTKTCNALQISGLMNVYGGPGTDMDVWSYAAGIGLKTCYSEFPKEYGRSDELLQRGSVEHINKVKNERDVYLCFHWTWEKNLDNNFSSLRQYLELIK